MNEEIIIDGVNVAECEYMLNNKIKGKQLSPAKAMPYAKETSCICRKNIDTPYNFCKHNSNCHYKQLKRLEQKYNEVLKLAKDNADSNEYCLQEDDEIIGKLQKENEELKFYIDSYKQVWEVDNYRKALEEIREMTKSVRYFPQERFELIKDVINKVLESEEK